MLHEQILGIIDTFIKHDEEVHRSLGHNAPSTTRYMRGNCKRFARFLQNQLPGSSLIYTGSYNIPGHVLVKYGDYAYDIKGGQPIEFLTYREHNPILDTISNGFAFNEAYHMPDGVYGTALIPLISQPAWKFDDWLEDDGVRSALEETLDYALNMESASIANQLIKKMEVNGWEDYVGY